MVGMTNKAARWMAQQAAMTLTQCEPKQHGWLQTVSRYGQ